MATIIYTIGSNPGRNFPGTSTGVAAAIAAIPNEDDGNHYVLAFGKETEIIYEGTLRFNNKVRHAGRTITVTAAAGESYLDHPNVEQNRYAYSAANGAAIAFSGSYGIAVETDAWVFLRDLQIYHIGFAPDVGIRTHTNSVVENVIMKLAYGGNYTHGIDQGGGIVRNTLVQLENSNVDGFHYGENNDTVTENCQVVWEPAVAGSRPAFVSDLSRTTLRNCAGFGGSAFVNNAALFNGSNNASDAAIGFGSGNKDLVQAADQFIDYVSTTTADYRTKDTSVLVDAGTKPSSDNIRSPSGSRQQGTAIDIGAWEQPSPIQSPTANITSIVVSGQNVTISGTTTAAPTNGVCSIQPASIAYNNAVAQGSIDLVLTEGQFQVQFSGVKVGRYSASVSVKNAYYETAATNSIGDFSVDGALATSVVQEPVDGQVLTVHGTTSGNPTSGILIVPAATANPGGAVDQQVPVTLGAGTFTVSVALPAGNYDAGILTFTTAAGTSLPQAGTRSVVILGINGNPTVPGDEPGAGKTASINLVSTNGIAIDAGPALKFAWFDQAMPDLFDAPTDTGTVVVGAGGTLKVALANSLKVSGQVGWLVVSNSDGDPAAVHKAFSGPVKVD